MLSDEADQVAARADAATDQGVIDAADRLGQGAGKIASSWSGSNLGYQALVYLQDYASPSRPFNRTWGLSDDRAGLSGWQLRSFEEVYGLIMDRAGSPDLEELHRAAQSAEDLFRELRSELESILSTALAQRDALFLSRKLEELRDLELLTVVNAREGQMPTGQMMTQDPNVDGTLRLAPHQEAIAQVVALKSPYANLDKLSKLARQVASHLRRAPEYAALQVQDKPAGDGKVFVGHGRSKEWMALSAFLEKRLGLEVDEFNRIPTAGIPTSERLQTMLNEATFAFLVLTGEDQRMDGELTARMNVIHEVGLFQGRLGFEARDCHT